MMAILVLAGCSSSAADSTVDTLGSEFVSGGSSDPGSFVGRPSGGTEAGADGEAVGSDSQSDGESAAESDVESGESLAGASDGQNEAPLVGTPSDDPGLSTDPDVVYVAGTCFVIPAPAAEAVEVGCDEPHVIEVYAIRDLPGEDGAPFLGLEAALGLCNQDFLRVTGVGLGLATIYTRSVLRPSEETWADGERDVTCYVRYPEQTSLSLAEINPVRDFGLVSIYGMEKGDCFVDFEDSETTFAPVRCEDPHDAEVFIDFEFPPGPYPGDEIVDQTADELCFGESFEAFVGRDYESSSVFSLRSRPNAETWGLGDRTINCLLTDELVRTGSFEGTGL